MVMAFQIFRGGLSIKRVKCKDAGSRVVNMLDTHTVNVVQCHRLRSTMSASSIYVPTSPSAHRRRILLSRPVSQVFDPYVNQAPCTACAIIQRRNFSRETISHYLSPEFAPIGAAQQALESVHAWTGLPWWASIVLTTLCLRTALTLPLAVYANSILAKVEALQPEIKQLSKDLSIEVAVAVKKLDWSNKIAKYHFHTNMKRLVRELYIRDNCHPLKITVGALVQIPLWISFSLALRNMAGALPFRQLENIVLCPDFATEGTLWFSNLLLADTTFVLPILLGFSNLLIVELHTLRMEKSSRFQKILTNFLRGISFAMVPIGASVPSCMCLYWCCSSVYGLAQNVAMKVPSVRRALRIPRSASESSTPFTDMWNIAKLKYTGRWKQGSPPSGSDSTSKKDS